MQWIINIMTAWAAAQGYMTAGYVHRGDPAFGDFALRDFITDNAWHDLDLSGIVPANAKGVLLALGFQATSAGRYLWLRKKDNVNTVVVAVRGTQVAWISYYDELTVACDDDRKIQYKISDTTWPFINMSVLAWWF